MLRQPMLACVWSGVLVTGMWLGFAQEASAQLVSRQETLRGHQRVFLSVVVPEEKVAAPDVNLRKASLEKYLVDRLREEQVDVATEFTDQTLILEVRVDLHPVIQADQKSVYAFISEFECIQAALLATNRQRSLVTTWKATQFGAVTKDQALRIRDSVMKNLEDFLTDWRATHPAASPAPVSEAAAPNAEASKPE